MSKQANPAMIGGFVVGAVALVVAGVLIFGGGQFFALKIPWVMYFDSSVKGLNVGAPVSFRGVKIGEVTDIKVVLNTGEATIRTPVYIEIEPERIVAIGEKRGIMKMVGGWFDRLLHPEIPAERPISDALVKRGLRAQLQLQSLVTGQLFVELDFYPDAPVRLTGLPNEVPEFPTMPSGLQKLSQSLEKIPLEDLANSALLAVQGFDQLVRSPELKGSIGSLNETMANLRRLTKDMETEFPSLEQNANEALKAASGAFKQAEVTLAMEKGAPGRLARSLESTSKAAEGAFKQAEVTLAMEEGAPGRIAKNLEATLAQSVSTLTTVERALEEESTLRYEVSTTLAELASAARSVRFLANYLERHPDALFVGKRGGTR
ncbi:MAG: MlaD family protein [Nitrospiraceae bacterium]